MGFEYEKELFGMAVLVVNGVLWNMFNLITTVLQQRSAGGIQTAAILISSISLCNVFLLLSSFGVIVSIWCDVLCWNYVPMFFCVFTYVLLISSSVSFWAVAWLSVFYCLKVVCFTSELLGKIKTNISSIIKAALAGTFLNSCGMFAPSFSLHFEQLENVTCGVTMPVLVSWINIYLYTIVLICYEALLPLMVMIPSSIRLVVHLYKHMLKMRRNNTEVQSSDSYLLLCKLTVSLVGVYITTLATISLFYISRQSGFGLSINTLLLGYQFFCIASGVLLTITNKNLREKLWVLFCTRPSNSLSVSLNGQIMKD